MLHNGPGDSDDNTIAEIDLEEILESILPGSEPLSNEKPAKHENDITVSEIDDPFSF